MAAPKALFDLQYHVCRSAAQVAASDGLGQAATLTQTMEELAGQSPQLRRLMAATVLTSPLGQRLTSIEHGALVANLLPKAERRAVEFVEVTGAREAFQRPAQATESSDRVREPELKQPTEWDVRYLHSEVASHADCTTAQTWFYTFAPLAEIAPRLDPQLWDANPDFIDEAFGIDINSDCNVQHGKTDEVYLGTAGYHNRRLHERVSGSFGQLSAGLSCDLTVSFEPAFGAAVPNRALYELHCNHERLIKRNEGQCYVRDEQALGRLVYASKHLCFTNDAPDFFRAIAPVLLPIWLRAILIGSLSPTPAGAPAPSGL